MNKYYLILLLSTLFSCSSPNEQESNSEIENTIRQIEANDFTKVIDLSVNSDSVKIPVDLLFVQALAANNDLVIALEKSDPNNLFRVFSVRNGKYLGGFGFTGSGPLDLEFARISPRGVTLVGNVLKVSDGKSLRTFLIDSKAAVESGKITNEHIQLVNRIRLPGTLINMDNPTLVGDSVIYGKPGDSKELLVSYNLNDKSIKDVFPYPNKFPEDVSAASKSTLYSKVFRYSSLHEKMAVGFRYFPLIRIYDLTNTKYVELRYKSENEQVSLKRQGGNVMHRVFIQLLWFC